MTPPIVYVDVSEISQGKIAELELAMKALASFVEANMPRVMSYGFYLDEKRTRMTVVAVHPDSASLEYHLDTGAAEFRKFSHLITLSRIDVYGHVSEVVLTRLHEKARALGSGTVAVHGLYEGFARRGRSPSSAAHR